MTATVFGAAVKTLRNWEGVEIGPLSTPLDIDDGNALKIFHRIMTALGLLIITLLLIGSIAPLRVTSNAVGQVVPSGSILPVNHLEGGIVAEIKASAGDIVEKGAPLIRMSPVNAASELDQLTSKRAYLTAQRIRYAALLDGAPPDFSQIAKTHPKFALDESSTYEQEKAAYDRSTEGLKARLAQRVASKTALEAELLSMRRQRALLAEQAKVERELFKQGFASRQDHLQTENAALNAEIDLTRLNGELAGAKEAALEAQHALDQLVAEKRAEWQSKATEIDAQIFEVGALALRSEDKVERLEIRSPSRAIVQELKPKAAGEVIRPGDQVATLLPLGEEIVAEIRMRPEDAGHVKVGQRAWVQVTSFDPGLYGKIDGDVLYISPTTFTDEKGGTYFKAKISLGSRHLKRGRKSYEILPGMMVQASIVTDERSVLSYLLKPINRAFQNAMTER
ncbi:MAG: HlyD family type I secretion periplasmic adaptor subunit [Parvularculaceae bacterium]|nr:HlyD family type I secretion periplasmic adaptor subunit [Parvularculaceae bacterium]